MQDQHNWGQGWELRRCPLCHKRKKFSRKSKRNWYKAEGPVNSDGAQPMRVCAHCAGRTYLSRKGAQHGQQASD